MGTMTDRLTITISTAVVLGFAWAASRWWNERQSPDTVSTDDTQGINIGALIDPYTEPTQITSPIEDALVFIMPTPAAHVDQETAGRNISAFLEMIAFAEGTAGRDGYKTLFGGRLFSSYDDHPRIRVPFRNTYSTAAGRYQFLERTWDTLKRRLNLPDFSPQSQDQAAIELIRERGALEDVKAGRLAVAIEKVRKVWASLPGAGYSQPEKSINALAAAFEQAGGTMEA